MIHTCLLNHLITDYLMSSGCLCVCVCSPIKKQEVTVLSVNVAMLACGLIFNFVLIHHFIGFISIEIIPE